jgi:hypothetical protein
VGAHQVELARGIHLEDELIPRRLLFAFSEGEMAMPFPVNTELAEAGDGDAPVFAVPSDVGLTLLGGERVHAYS